MKFLLKQVIIITLVCIFFMALSSLTQLGIVGWILAASTGHGLYKIFIRVNNNSQNEVKQKCITCAPEEPDFSKRLESFMYDDATGIQGDD